MKKLLLTSSAILALCMANAQSQPSDLRMYPGSSARNFAPQSNNNQIIVGATDTLQYFYNKHFYLNANTGNPVPNQNFWTIKNWKTGTIQHCGSVFLNSSNIMVHGLEGMVMRQALSVNPSVDVKLYLCNVTIANVPILPALDSVITQVSTSNGGIFVGGTFTNGPVSISGNFAVLMKNGSANNQDTISLFMTNAATATSASPANEKFNENLSYRRLNGAFQSQVNAYGTGTAFEFIVAPRISFDLEAEITVGSSTICTNSYGSFTNTSKPANVIENRQFNFNKFHQTWSTMAIQTLSSTAMTGKLHDSIYTWAFQGSSTTSSFQKNPLVNFNTPGTHNLDLTVKYRPMANGGYMLPYVDMTTETITVSSNLAPVLSISGPTAICLGSNAVLVASGNTTFTWTTPNSQQAQITVQPVTSTVYKVNGENNGCVGTQTFMVKVSTNPVVAITGPAKVCTGANFILGASGAETYSWSTSAITTSIIANFTAAGEQTYAVTGINPGCNAVTVMKTVTVQARPEVYLDADMNNLCTKATGGTSIALTGSPSGGNYSGSGGPGVGFEKFTPNNAGTVTAIYSYTDAVTGCTNSATTKIIIAACVTNTNTDVGVASEKLNANLSVYPNPTTDGKIMVKNLNGTNIVSIYNILGGLVSREVVTASEYAADLSGQSEGQYIMRVSDANGDVSTVKIINRK